MHKIRKVTCFLVAFLLAFSTVIQLDTGVANAANTGGSKYYKVKNLELPESIKEGTDFKVKGSITSDNYISYVKVNVIEKTENKQSDKSIKGFLKESRPKKSKKYDLAEATASFNFANLKEGKYYIKVRIRDSKKNVENLVHEEFEVYDPTFRIEEVSIPTKAHEGNPFWVEGKITATKKMDVLYAGAQDSKGNWVKGAYVKINPKSKKYDLAKQDANIKISKLPAGLYTYKVRVRNIDGVAKTLVEENFTVSRLEVKSPTKPLTIKEGKGFFVRGDVKSKFDIDTVKVGVQDKTGKWQDGVVAEASPKKTTSYDIKALDSKIKFGKLGAGSYDYKVIAEDKYGVERTLVDQSFKVVGENPPPSNNGGNNNSGSGTVPSSGVVKLGYDVNTLYNIGKQPFSGPCGLYAMAYGRLVIDGYFGLDGYSSYYDKLHAEYGLGSNSAHWSEAGAGTVRTTSVSSVAKLALAELQKGRPVILDLKSGYTGNQHFVTAIGYKKGTTVDNVSVESFIVLDPASGSERMLSDYPLYQLDPVDMRIIRFW